MTMTATTTAQDLGTDEVMDELMTALVGLVERQMMADRVGAEWRNPREDERVRGEVVAALRTVVALEVRATLRDLLTVRA